MGEEWSHSPRRTYHKFLAKRGIFFLFQAHFEKKWSAGFEKKVQFPALFALLFFPQIVSPSTQSSTVQYSVLTLRLAAEKADLNEILDISLSSFS